MQSSLSFLCLINHPTDVVLYTPYKNKKRVYTHTRVDSFYFKPIYHMVAAVLDSWEVAYVFW